MRIIQVEQGSPEWFLARCGVPSASNFDKIIQANGKPSKSREKYLYQLAGEKVAGFKAEAFQSAAMAKGVETEAEARMFYEIQNSCTVEQVGFCLSDSGLYGCSPDGLVNGDGLIEIKCPLIHTHVSYLINGGLVEEYFQQVQGQLFVTGSNWCDVMSYFPGLRPLIVRVEPDEKFINALEVELLGFCRELNETVKQIGG